LHGFGKKLRASAARDSACRKTDSDRRPLLAPFIAKSGVLDSCGMHHFGRIGRGWGKEPADRAGIARQ
jgi:hypothetical protein